jgi:hypothetical protein
MKSSLILFVIFAIASLFGVSYADVPPDPGYKRVTQNLVVESAEEFVEYRFFIKSGADLNEVVLKKGEALTIKPLGGGSYYRLGTFLAVPKANLTPLSDTATGSELSALKKAVYDGKVAGTIELIKHGFVRDVSAKEAAGLKDPVYRIEKDANNGLKVIQVSGGGESKGEAGTGFTIYSTDSKPPAFWAAVAGGSLMTLAFIFLGVWVIRRSKSKSVELGPTR